MQTLIGKNGAMVGSAPYFQKLNEGTIIGDLMRSCFGTANSTNYAGLYDKLKAKSDDAVEEIFWDLKKYVGVMRHFPKDDRDNLVAFIKALEELKGFGNQGSISKASSCIDILTLNSYDTKPQSRADLRDIEAAAKRASQKNRSTALELVKRAADYGITRAAGSDSWKLAFLHDTIGPYSQNFYKDLYIYMDFQENHRYMRGKCYKELCTPEYVAEMEKEVFGNAAGQFSGSYSYYAVFLNGLKEIAAELEADLNQNSGTIQPDYKKDLIDAAKQLDKLLSTSVKDKIPKTVKHDTAKEELNEDTDKGRAAKVIMEHADEIKMAATRYQVDAAIIAGCIFTEQYLNVDFVDDLTDWIGATGILDTSIGIGQVKVSTAKQLEEAGYMSKTYVDNGVNFVIPTPLTTSVKELNQRAETAARAKRLDNDYENIMYVAAYLSQFVDQWKEEFPEISVRPDILGTLFNLGYRTPNPNPSPNSFGSTVGENYQYMRELLELN
ncbi:MAG: hypothetical protein DBY45_04840 [Clostridiales bacterium]|nr:MAG: hypothetical protein DBY45_04840 [Clostridiales bacterium]